jgi:chemotaxis protein MotB
MARKRSIHVESAGSGAERWLLTYADMITLLLALFIVLFAMSTIDGHKFDAIRSSLSDAFGRPVLVGPAHIVGGSSGALDPTAATDGPPVTTIQDPLDQTAAQRRLRSQQAGAERALRNAQLEVGAQAGDQSDVTITSRGVVISLAGDSFFASGSADVRPRMLAALRRLATVLTADRTQLSVEGNTDAQPLHSTLFRDNWGLSTARAQSVLEALRDGGVPDWQFYSVVGYGAGRPLVPPPADDPQAPVRENRRVDIVILASGMGNVEYGSPTGLDPESSDHADTSGEPTPSPGASTPTPAVPLQVIPPIVGTAATS